MALTPLTTRTGIVALTFAATLAPFGLATPVNAITIGFGDSVEGAGRTKLTCLRCSTNDECS